MAGVGHSLDQDRPRRAVSLTFPPHRHQSVAMRSLCLVIPPRSAHATPRGRVFSHRGSQEDPGSSRYYDR
jgi:hypothetical protein